MRKLLLASGLVLAAIVRAGLAQAQSADPSCTSFSCLQVQSNITNPLTNTTANSRANTPKNTTNNSTNTATSNTNNNTNNTANNTTNTANTIQAALKDSVVGGGTL